MSDFDQLLATFDSGVLLRPLPDLPNLVDLARALAALAGAEDAPATGGSRAIAERIGNVDHLVFILVDGLGMNILEEGAVRSFLSDHLAQELRTVFPSATAVALTSLATGQWPASHGVTGWWTHLPEIGLASTALQFTTRSDTRPLSRLGLRPEDVYPVPSLMGRASRNTLLLFPDKIAHSVYSSYFSDGRSVAGYDGLAKAVDLTARRIRGAKEPTFTYIYLSQVDDSAHALGTHHPDVTRAVREIDGEVARLASLLDGRGRIVVSADHGFLDANRNQRHQIRAWEPLLGMLRFPPTGDTRVLYLHVRERSEARIRDYFKSRFGERFAMLTTDEAEHLGLLGDGGLSSRTRERVGDMVAISTGADAIEFRPSSGAGRVLQEAAQHSGLTPQEMRIPLVIV